MSARLAVGEKGTNVDAYDDMFENPKSRWSFGEVLFRVNASSKTLERLSEKCLWEPTSGVNAEVVGVWRREPDAEDPAPDVLSSRVDHPKHYNTGKIEVIEAIEDWKLGFCLGNTVKYIARAPHKGNQLEDLKKAKWYLDREIQTLEKQGVENGPR